VTGRRRRLVATAVTLAIVASMPACGDDDEATSGPDEPVATTTTTADTSTETSPGTTGGTTAPAPGEECPPMEALPDPGALALEAHVPERAESGAPVTWEATVTNTLDEPVTMIFPSGQILEVVLEAGGTEAYRYSDGRGFTEALVCRELAPGETETFSVEEDQGLAVDPGTYEVRVDLVADPRPATFTASLTVEPAG
jgi:hypothetical protein